MVQQIDIARSLLFGSSTAPLWSRTQYPVILLNRKQMG